MPLSKVSNQILRKRELIKMILILVKYKALYYLHARGETMV